MADYINKHILGQAYVKLDLDFDETVESYDTDALKAELTQYFSKRAKHFIYNEVDVDVEFREGSFKSIITVFGVLYIAIGQYGDFRQGVQVLHEDIKWLAEAGAKESIFQLKVRSSCVIHKEARVGVIGILKRILDDIEAIRTNDGKVDQTQQAKRLERIVEETTRLNQLLKDPKDRDCVMKGLLGEIESIPNSPTEPAGKKADLFALQNYRKHRAEFEKSVAELSLGEPPQPSLFDT